MYSPTFCTRSPRSGLRSSALNGPRNPCRGPLWIESATRFWSGVMLAAVSGLNRGAVIFVSPVSGNAGNQPAVDDDLRSGYIARLIGREEQDRICNVPRVAHLAHRHARVAVGDQL